ncbi:hypothetical protein M0E82_01845 [Corynebacterium sp. P7202]|uniref:Uncharacterized protein n=1 Tax=Corynebacterium pygosceleis TaxID=2800406 RepID=A0A9Q4C5R6_9CORY|nr:hypothetical protein [Corynebacterium pygosceleis]MCK7636750.1 hypothetical protein [Corynebacterium pygosceleis]MCX7467504.1 hypothetical protein [Corynebacterium pygosceleis]
MKKLPVIAAVLVLSSPALLLLGVGMIFTPGANASCPTSTSGPSVVGPVPDSLEVTAADGQTSTLNTTQLTHAATIIQTGSQIKGVTRDGLQIALIAALTESTLRMLANTSVYPDSGTYPKDGDPPTMTASACSKYDPKPGGRGPRPHGLHLPSPRILRRTHRPQPPLTPRPTQHPQPANHTQGRSRPSRRGVGLPRPVRELRAGRRTDPDHPPQPRHEPVARTTHPINWNLLSAQDLEAELLELNRWVDWLRHTYHLPASVAPQYWHRHPELVWKLSALHLHWLCAYDPKQNGSAPLG